MDAKASAAIASLVELWQRRDDNLDKAIIAWSGRNLEPSKANEIIDIIRKAHSAPDVKNDLAALVASLTQPTIN